MIQKSVQIRRIERRSGRREPTGGRQTDRMPRRVRTAGPELPTESGLAGNLPSLPGINPRFESFPSSPYEPPNPDHFDQESSDRFRPNPRCM